MSGESSLYPAGDDARSRQILEALEVEAPSGFAPVSADAVNALKLLLN
jgi:hypothetical protein